MTGDPPRLPPRFYRLASVRLAQGGQWQIALDERALRSPGGRDLHLPTEALAGLVAAEWQRQGASLDLASMTATRLANVAVDHAASARAAMVESALDHVATDLLRFRDPQDSRLAAAQESAFSPLLSRMQTEFGIALSRTHGLTVPLLDDATRTALARWLWPVPPSLASEQAPTLDAGANWSLWRLTLLSAAAPLLGSTGLALALADGWIDAGEAFGLSRLEEEHQARLWGRDAEADARAAAIERELSVYSAMLRALGPSPASTGV